MPAQTPLVGPPAPLVGSEPAVPDRKTLERFAEATRYFERSYRNAAGGKLSPQNGLVWNAIGRATSTINPASGGTYGGGTVTFQLDTGSALADDSTMTGITVKNLTNKTIAAGSNSRLFLAWALGSWWVVNVSDCALLS